MNHTYKERSSLAAAVEPGDATHYEFCLVKMWDVYEIIVLNSAFFDKLTFLKDGTFYQSYRNNMNEIYEDFGSTNPWTIRAAQLMILKYLAKKENKS